MFLRAFRDLLKPQWLDAMRELKLSGGSAVSDLARRLNLSYMTVKQHCEDLTRKGYLERTRVPRTAIGRPEIFYRLSERGAGLFPGVPEEFTLDLLTQVKKMFGETAPERLLFQYFREKEEAWKRNLDREGSGADRLDGLIRLMGKEGYFLEKRDAGNGRGLAFVIFHNPLGPILEAYPKAIAMERRAIEAGMGMRGMVKDWDSSTVFEFSG